MREEVEELKKELNEVKEQSLAFELLQSMKASNKRLFIIILVILSMWVCTLGYLIYVINDVGTIESDTDTIDIQDVESIDNSHIKIGDDVWEKSE